ncbi:MAG: hypothetical protein C5B54_07570 [Acidobacteria bacterium]|nr:MAG: hypothetical protein C5B54_07570 [Acidobacteriota bacterium]
MKVSNQGKVLMVLTGLLALSIFLNFSPRQTPTWTPVVHEQPLPKDIYPDPIPRVDLLKIDPTTFSGVQRNVFLFQTSQEAKITQAPQTETAEPDQTTAQSAPEVPNVKYVGLYRERKANGQTLAVISSAGTILVGGKGEILGNKFQILQIEEDYIVLKLLEDGRIFRLQLGKDSVPLLENERHQTASNIQG